MDEELQRLTEGAYGVPFLRALTNRLGAIYEEAFDELSLEYDPPEMHDLLPHIRRAKFERDMRLLAGRFGLTGFARRNQRKTSFHTRITAPNMILTASAVATPKTLVRHAEFRQTLARDPQLSLLPDADEGSGTAYYSLYIHGPLVTPEGLSLPKLGFAHLVFPDRFLTKYVGRVDLLSTYAAERAPVNIPVEEIRRATVTLLERLREEHA
ncbi:MAG TPA: hypothetical protein VMT95_09850 [Candidatus Binatia bacterium]|nr:hypothetical protein [Candidatus Binatia bacterium]